MRVSVCVVYAYRIACREWIEEKRGLNDETFTLTECVIDTD